MVSVRRLRWITVVVPTVFVVAFELVTRGVYADSIPAWGHTVVILAAISGGAFGFSTFVFATMGSLQREIRERNRRLALLNTVAREASESLDLEEVAAVVNRNVMAAMGASAGGVALISEEDGELRLVAESQLPLKMTRRDTLGPYDCECRKSMGIDQTIVVADSRENAACAGILANDLPATCVNAPIRSKGNTIGTLFVARPRSRPFDAREKALIAAVGSQVGPALHNAQLFSRTGAIAVLQERQRVAREVHDGLSQTLGYLSVQMGIVDRLMRNGEGDKAQAELDEMTQVTREAYEDLRRSIGDLRTPISSAAGLRRTLREYAERFSEQTGIPCHFEGHRGSAALLSPSAEVQLFRIIQEALANVKKHAANSQAWLTIESNHQSVEVTVRDDGPGFDPAALSSGGRFGLQTMKERAESVGGRLVVESHPETGTRIRVTIPTEESKAA
jgi:signal transduction histidine kinase